MASLAHRGGVDGDTVDSGGQTGKLAELDNFGDEGKKHVLGELIFLQHPLQVLQVIR